MYYYSEEPNYNEDYNYPSLNRKDLMSLDTIKEKDFPRKKINSINSKRNWSQNLNNLDIDKSYPKRNDIFLNKIDFINKLDDIEKARPNKAKIINKSNYMLNVQNLEKEYPKKGNNLNIKKYNSLENKLLVPQYQLKNNSNNKNEAYEKLYNNINMQNTNNRYFEKKNNIYYNNRYNKEINKNNSKDTYFSSDKIYSYNSYKMKNDSTKPLDIIHVIQSQKEYKDTINDIFNNYPEYINGSMPKNYLLNHHHDLTIGNSNKKRRLDFFLDKSKQIKSYDFSTKMNLNNKVNKYDFLNSHDSVKINRNIPIEFKNQGLENLYKELDNYKPKTYEQYLDSFTHNF